NNVCFTATSVDFSQTAMNCKYTVGIFLDLCEYRQAQEDDFDWQLVRTYSWPHMTSDLTRGSYMLVNSSQYGAGQRAQLMLRPLSENDTHCVQFSYFLYSRDGHSPGVLTVYVRVNGGSRGNAVWNVSGSQGRQWHQVELAVSTFWPSEYQIVFEATISSEQKGYIGLDDIVLLNYPCYKVPHFSRLGDVEVNAGQNATFQCVATGRSTKTDPFLMERRNGVLMSPYSVTSSIGERRLVAWFQVGGAQRGEQDLYRCITQSTYGAAVSNFAELIVRVPPTPIAPPQLLRSGPTYLIIQLNTNSIVGDGPVIRREIVYRASHSPWSETHGVNSLTYKVWHLEPDTEYRISVLLTRPGEGGTGPPGPPLVSRTKCAEPMRPLRGLTASEIQSRQLLLQWEPVGYNLTRCHTYSLSLCYRYSTAAGGGASGNNATVRECLSVERNTSRFTLRDLPPFHSVHVRLALANPEGKKESREVTFQTEEDIPGGIAPESLTFTPLDDMIFLKWEEPLEPNGLITQYEISYQSIESSDPSINVPGPRRTVSKLKNETYHMFSGLHPGTTYLVSVRARTAKGFGQTALTEITTNISGEEMLLSVSVHLLSFILCSRKKVNINKAVMTYRQEKTRKLGSLDCSTTEHSTLQQDDRTTHTFMDSHNCTARSNTVNESSSLLGGSPRRHCRRKSSPYHTGQLHPAVRVADLLQHINQMKTGEGYGFKQEYEVRLYRHRVKMHSLLADPNSDYVNANYIDDMIYDFWRMVWQENCYSIVMITKLVEVGRMKCCKYWPDDSELYGDIKITLLKTETLAEYTVRTFAMERRGYPAKHEVCQFHFTNWPEHGVPYHATGLLAFLRRVKASTPPDAGPVVVHCSMGAGRTGCYIVLDVMLDMAECEGVVDIYNCVKTLCSRRINMIQTEEQYIFIHDAILEACLCGETAIPISEFELTYKDMLSVDSQTNTSQLREEFQTLNSVTPHLDVEECSVSLLPRNREKNRSMDVLPPDRALAFLVSTEGDGNNYINAALMDSFLQPAAFVVTPHPLPTTTADFWRLVFDYSCTSIIMLNQLNQSNSPCLQYWPETGMQQFGPMTVELLSRSTDDNVVTRLFRVTNITRLQEGHLVVRHFQFLRWSAYREIPDSKKAFLNLLAQVQKWQRECGDGRTVVHCLNGGGRSGTFCACTMIMEMVHHHNMVDVFYAVKTLRNSKPNMVESMVSVLTFVNN
uniref:Receptor-type tyrosine-protein phosphatase U n=1 Tax=Cyprinus carpio TaxID=7962 RepID=A0A8C1TEP3_CYPCA